MLIYILIALILAVFGVWLASQEIRLQTQQNITNEEFSAIYGVILTILKRNDPENFKKICKIDVNAEKLEEDTQKHLDDALN